VAERAIGIDVGGTKIAAGVIDRNGRILRRVERPTPTESRDEFLELLDEIVDDLRAEAAEAIGFGLPSTIDQRTGRVVGSVHVPLADFDFRDHAAARFSIPVALDNDGNAAAIAEWKIGAGRGASDMIMLTLGTGVGGGLILDGKPYRGWVGAGAEIGHMVLAYGGEPCTGRELVGAARDGNGEALEAVREIGRRLGAALGSLVNVFNPEVIVIGGGFSQARDLFLEPALETMKLEALPPGRDLVRVVPALLGPDAGLVGAGFVGFEAL